MTDRYRSQAPARSAWGAILVEALAGLAAVATIWVFVEEWAVDRGAPAEEPETSVPVDPTGPPPEAPATPDVVICEVVVKGSGMDPLRERITLCNHGPQAVDLGGWTLEDGQGDLAIPYGTGVLPGGRWSVVGADFNSLGDRRGLWLNDTGDLVRLRDPTGRLIDECGWPPRTPTATCDKLWR